VKTDKVDARIIALYLRSEILKLVKVLDETLEMDLSGVEKCHPSSHLPHPDRKIS
jgi:hypothetical protein